MDANQKMQMFKSAVEIARGSDVNEWLGKKPFLGFVKDIYQELLQTIPNPVPPQKLLLNGMPYKVKKYHNVLHQLILAHLESRKQTQHRITALGLFEYLRQHATIRCNIGRGVGNTSFIVLRSYEDPIAVVTRLMNKNLFQNAAFHVSAADINAGNPLPDKSYPFVFVDDPTATFSAIRGGSTDVYALFGKDSGQTFVLLGE